MNRYLIAIMAAGVMCAGVGAFAEEAPSGMQTPPASSSETPSNASAVPVKPMSKHQMMKQCMVRAAAKSDGSTKAQMKKSCKAEVNGNMSVQDSMKK